MRSSVPEVEDFSELMQNIQSRLPLKEAARTSVLSKSWLHAWSTIPTLTFDVGRGKRMKLEDVDRTLIRYLRDNVPIERFKLTIKIDNQESATYAEKLITPVATKTCLKEFYLSAIIDDASFTLPNAILSAENLTKIRISASPLTGPLYIIYCLHPVITCMSLQELHLDGVFISEEVLNGILSSCSLLVKIVLLKSFEGFKTIKVKNLPRLYELRIALDAAPPTALEISGVPNLGVFSYNLDLQYWRHEHPPPPINTYSISLGSNVTRLMLAGVITDNVCLDIFKSQFPLLESLTLFMTSWMVGSFQFTCASIKRLSLIYCPDMLLDVQVYAPKLLCFELCGGLLPSLLFPDSSLEQMTVSLSLELPLDANFFLKMREALMLSRKCYLHISANNASLPWDIDIDDLKTSLLFPPATNVQQLSFETGEDECLWQRSPFFDAFFEVCHPQHVLAKPDLQNSYNNHFCRLMLSEVLEKKKTRTAYWIHYLKHVQIRRYPHEMWKPLTNSHRSFLDGLALNGRLEFKLQWS